MDYTSFNEWYINVKPLLQSEYEAAKVKATKVVEKRIGNKPTKKEFERETKNIWNPITVLITVVFVATWFVSSIEQFRFMGHEAFQFSQRIIDYIGVPLNANIVSYIFQFGIITITEFSMILFMVQWRIQTKHIVRTFYYKSKTLNHILSWVIQFFNVYFFLAILSMIIVLYINITSGMFILLGIAVPLFTIGLGLGIEEVISEYIIEQDRIQIEYTKEYNLWQDVSKEPEKHPQWKSILYQSIWDSIIARNNRYNSGYNMDVIGDWKALAVEKELERDEWSTERVRNKEIAKAAPQITIEDLQGKNELEILLTMVQNWNPKMNPIVKTENYKVDMVNYIYESEFEEPVKYSSIGFLERRIKNNINKSRGNENVN